MRLERWTPEELPLMRRLLGDPVMTEHLGGPESEEKLAERLQRYVDDEPTMFKIAEDGEPLGSVGFWEREWRGEEVFEIGWSVLPEHQGRGIASRGTAMAVELAAATGRRRWLDAFPSISTPASNALCRTLGFELLSAVEFEYPKGSLMTCNDWRYDLREAATYP